MWLKEPNHPKVTPLNGEGKRKYKVKNQSIVIEALTIAVVSKYLCSSWVFSLACVYFLLEHAK